MSKISKAVKEQIRKLYPDHENVEIAAITGLSVIQIKNFVYRFNETHDACKAIKKKVSIYLMSEAKVQLNLI
ncbi:MAG: hypothetical protein MJZ60_00050 [Bacteroidaceae bacterium]|nr:hypothetical protein [Bacteroidaceae bacterium]